MNEQLRLSYIRRLMRRAERHAALADNLEQLAGAMVSDVDIPVGLVPDRFLDTRPFAEAEEIRVVLRAIRSGEEGRRSKRVVAALRERSAEYPRLALALSAAALHLERHPWLYAEADGLLRWIHGIDHSAALNALIDFVSAENQQEIEARVVREANEWHSRHHSESEPTA